MGETELQAELESTLRKRYMPSFAQQLKQQEELAVLSNDEWWEQHLQESSSLDPRFKTLADGVKEHMIEHRFDRLHFLKRDGWQQVFEAEVEKLLPAIVQVRLEWNEDGPLTEEQLNAALIQTSLSQFAETAGLFYDAVVKQTDPRKRDFMAKFAANLELDMQEMKVLADPDIKQDQLDEVTAKITERMNELTKSLHLEG